MAKARNNVARLPFEARKRVCEMLFDGASYDSIRDAISSSPCCQRSENSTDMSRLHLVAHNSSLLAYQNSSEYIQYCDSRKSWEKQTLPNRWAATLLNDGRGIESAADLAAMELLGQIHELSGAGLEVSDAQKLAASVVALKRSAASSKEKAMKADFEAKEAAWLEKIAGLEAEIERLSSEKKKTSGGLSEETLKAIEEQAGIM